MVGTTIVSGIIPIQHILTLLMEVISIICGDERKSIVEYRPEWGWKNGFLKNMNKITNCNAGFQRAGAMNAWAFATARETVGVSIGISLAFNVLAYFICDC